MKKVTHVAHEPPAGPGQHGQGEQVEVEGVGLVLIVLPDEAGQPKLRDEEALRPLPILQHHSAKGYYQSQSHSLEDRLSPMSRWLQLLQSVDNRLSETGTSSVVTAAWFVIHACCKTSCKKSSYNMYEPCNGKHTKGACAAS